MPTLFEEPMLCSEEVHILFCLVLSMLKSALSVLEMIALSWDVCCEDGYMYIYEALSHMTLHSKHGTLVTSCYKENGGIMKA